MRAVPTSLPSLMRTQKLFSKAQRAGIDVSGISCSLVDAAEQLNSVLTGEQPDTDSESAVAELLFAAVGAAESVGVDAEEALSRRAERFIGECE